MGSYLTSSIEFTKMHGAGNDYIYVNALRERISDPGRLAREISDRHFGIGSDGLVMILHSKVADFRMRMFNADGSEAQMCGNAARCIAKYVYDHQLTINNTVTLETLAGIKTMRLNIDDKNGAVSSVTVDMGIPELRPDKIPVIPTSGDKNGYSSVVMDYLGEDFEAIAASMGNPHAVIFIDEITDRHVLDVGKALEMDPAWPEKTNVEFVKVINRSAIEMRVWERGSGETLACGTGACASVMAGILSGRLDDDVTVHLRGGSLQIHFDRKTGHILMTGKAVTIAEGKYFPKSSIS